MSTLTSWAWAIRLASTQSFWNWSVCMTRSVASRTKLCSAPVSGPASALRPVGQRFLHVRLDVDSGEQLFGDLVGDVGLDRRVRAQGLHGLDVAACVPDLVPQEQRQDRDRREHHADHEENRNPEAMRPPPCLRCLLEPVSPERRRVPRSPLRAARSVAGPLSSSARSASIDASPELVESLFCSLTPRPLGRPWSDRSSVRGHCRASWWSAAANTAMKSSPMVTTVQPCSSVSAIALPASSSHRNGLEHRNVAVGVAAG